MFWSKLCKSNRNCAWNFAFISVMTISPIVWTMCEHLHYESVSFKELHKEQEYYWPTMYRAGAAAVSTITSLLVWRSVLKLQSSCHRFETRVNTVKENWGLKKLFTSIKKKKERRTALVTAKMPKLGNSYNLLREAYYEASLPFLLDC